MSGLRRLDPSSSTYRVQLHAGFGFDAAASISEYLSALGISHLYCSPYSQAAPGSRHGYDVADPNRLSAELGGHPGHTRMTRALRQAGLGQVLDIVPNHMVADPKANTWWWDVLENGPASRFAFVFDIDWQAGDAYTVLVPILDDHMGRVLEKGDIRISRRSGSFVVGYHGHELPVSPRSVADLLAGAGRRGPAALAELADGFAGLPSARSTDLRSVRVRHERKEALVANLAELCRDDHAIAEAVDAEVAAVNDDPDRLEQILRRQNYRLAYWRTASEELDYRRFFNIESLAGVRMEDPHVFGLTHQLVTGLVSDGTVCGLRIDHIDGLADPATYLRRLRQAAGETYMVVEKILKTGEELPAWPVAGTTGYDFLNRVNDLFVDSRAEPFMTSLYEEFSGLSFSWEDVVHQAKLQTMRSELSAEVDRLSSLLSAVCDGHRRHRDHTRRELRRTVEELVAHFRVYRTYVVPGSASSAEDRRRVHEALEGARTCRAELDPELLDFCGELALGEHPGTAEADFARRLQQLTAPVMAKGVEDTAFYRYHRLISLNEVGGDPGRFGRPIGDFHRDTGVAARRRPAAMLTLSTHDTKRSADVRARLNVLSELPQRWAEAVTAWAALNDRHRDGDWPDRNDEYLLYQALVGAWPISKERAATFMAKATKEAKLHTSWTDPNAVYDQSLAQFVSDVLGDAAFTGSLEAFLSATSLVERGRRNSLAQAALLLTCPGVADIYQGTELWDLSLVDPDNRRSVDFDRRHALLAATDGELPALSADEWGVAKIRMIHRLLADRRCHPERYVNPEYEPLEIAGPATESVVGFRRSGLVVVAACRYDIGDGTVPVDLPPGKWRDLLGDRPHRGRVSLGSLLGGSSVAVLGTEEH